MARAVIETPSMCNLIRNIMMRETVEPSVLRLSSAAQQRAATWTRQRDRRPTMAHAPRRRTISGQDGILTKRNIADRAMATMAIEPGTDEGAAATSNVVVKTSLVSTMLIHGTYVTMTIIRDKATGALLHYSFGPRHPGPTAG